MAHSAITPTTLNDMANNVQQKRNGSPISQEPNDDSFPLDDFDRDSKQCSTSEKNTILPNQSKSNQKTLLKLQPCHVSNPGPMIAILPSVPTVKTKSMGLICSDKSILTTNALSLHTSPCHFLLPHK